MPSMKDQHKGSEAPRLSKVGSVGIPIEQFPERSETGFENRRRMPIPFVVAGLIFVGSAVGSAVIGYYVEMGLDAIHGVGDDPDQ